MLPYSPSPRCPQSFKNLSQILSFLYLKFPDELSSHRIKSQGTNCGIKAPHSTFSNLIQHSFVYLLYSICIALPSVLKPLQLHAILSIFVLYLFSGLFSHILTCWLSSGLTVSEMPSFDHPNKIAPPVPSLLYFIYITYHTLKICCVYFPLEVEALISSF